MFCTIVLSAPSAQGQMRVQPVVDQQGTVGLGLLLRKLGTVGTFMMATAHPDDENNALLAMLSHGQGIRTALVSATRGDGGQNEIGAELFDALAVLRTEELLAAHRFDGAEQYFTRAVDFGYSFSIEETFERWGREEILGDFVRMIRTIRPDVIVGLRPDAPGGGQHHHASAVLASEAFRAAADAERFPKQLAEGLRPWQAAKFYFSVGFSFRGEPRAPEGASVVTIDVGGYDPLLGRTYAEIGSEARSMHKCQGMSQLLQLPQSAQARYYLADTTLDQLTKDESLFDGITTSITELRRYVESRPPRELTLSLSILDRHVREAQRAFEQSGVDATRTPLLSGLSAVRNLRGRLNSLDLDETAAYEIDFRLKTKEEQFARAAILAHGIRVEALADDGVVTPGQAVRISALVANRGSADIAVRRVSFAGVDGTGLGCGTDVVDSQAVYTCASNLAIPADAKLTTPYFEQLPDAARYVFEPEAPFGLPFEPTPFRAAFAIEFASERVDIEAPIQYRYEREIFSGEKRMEIKVVPALSVRVSPEIAVVLASGGSTSREREIRVIVTNRNLDPIEGTVSLAVPAGWRAEPEWASVAFVRQDEERTARFLVTPPRDAQLGEYAIRGQVVSEGTTFDRGYRVVEYPHIQLRHLVTSADATIKVIDVHVADVVLVGYVMGAGDQMPAAIEQLGVRLEQLTAEDLAWGDLSRFNVIITGIRAYELDRHLRAHNDRLIQYVEDGGVLIVQYNKFGFNDAQFGPHPAQVSSNRITDEAAPVEVLVPDHPVFTFPNRINEASWDGWVQERGLYFLGDRDPLYTDLVQMEDPFESNPGVKRGALVEARVGTGRWLYVALGLWRQLPAGTDGAYQLLANLISLGKTIDQ